jgi:hypothetical protein
VTTAGIDIGTLIACDADICGDRPRIAGTRITVGRIATLWKQGLTPERFPRAAQWFPRAAQWFPCAVQVKGRWGRWGG